jgi:ATP-binding cassette subfamily A (ABC1) protein 3
LQHFLEEADLLGDRIAIMAEGSARCAGSGMFLKQRFGLGYTLTVVKADHGVAVDAIVATLRAHVPSVVIAGDAGQELKLTLPLESSSSFEPMFAALDAAREALGVVAYGMSITTLEDVFLRAADDPSALLPGHGHGSAAGGARARGATAVVVNVAHSDRTLAALTAAEEATPSDGSHGSGSTTYGAASIAVGAAAGGTVKNGMPGAAVAAGGGATLSVSEMRRRARTELVGCSGFCKHVYAIILKRAAFARRDLRTLLCQVLIPVVLVVGGLALIGLAQGLATQPSLQLSTAYFNNDPRKYNAVPVAPNYLPYAAYKTGPGGAAAAADVAAFLARIPAANASLSTAAPAFALSAAAAAATVDKYGFATAGAGSPLGDWQNASSWLLGNVGSVAASVYGAVLFEGGPGTLVPGQSAASVFPTGGDNALTYTVMHNTTAQHTAPLYVNLVNSAAYARATGAADASITARTYPLPLTKLQAALFNSALTGVAALLIMVRDAAVSRHSDTGAAPRARPRGGLRRSSPSASLTCRHR